MKTIENNFQAEFGDHDPEKHTAEYIQDFPLLPKPMMAQLTEDRLSNLFCNKLPVAGNIKSCILCMIPEAQVRLRITRINCEQKPEQL